MMGELCRSSSDRTIPFRKVAGKNGHQEGYSSVRIRDLPMLSSVFAGLAFEDINEAMLTGVLTTKTGRKQIEPPTEQLLKW
jgi:hypothetical protein